MNARAYEDLSHPDGGQIVVLLHDIVRTPNPCGFRLSPVGAAHGQSAPGGWPEGELIAADTRTTKIGVEVVLGPEVWGYAGLAAGTLIEITLTGTKIRARFVWPHTSAEKPLRRRNITLVPPRRGGRAEAARGPAGRARAVPMDATVLPTPMADAPTESRHQPAGARSPAASAKEPTAMSPAPSIFDKLAALDALAEGGEQSATAAKAGGSDKVTALPQETVRMPARPADPVVAMLSELKRDIAQLKQEQVAAAPHDEQRLYAMLAELRHDIESLRHREEQIALPPGEKQLYGLLAELRRDIETLKRQEAGHDLAPGEKQLYGLLAELRRDIEVLKHHEAAQAQALAPGEQQLYAMLSDLRRDIEVLRHQEAAQQHVSAAERELFGMLAELKRDIRDLQGHQQPRPAGEPRDRAVPAARRRGEARWPFAGFGGTALRGQPLLSMILMAVVPVAAILLLASDGWRRSGEPAPGHALALPPIAAVPAPRPPEASSAGSPIFDALAAGNVSPKGVDATGMAPSEILVRINAERQAGRGRFGAEGEFWMKRYLIASLGDNSTARVLTQLGTIYADGGVNGDYAKARQLWEVAGALGDGVAMCFLGALYDSGLGVAADRRVALQWYARARDAGGCAGAERPAAGAR